MPSTACPTRLVNVRAAKLVTGPLGDRLVPFGGAWGRPEDALSYARKAGAHVVGVVITDVVTNESIFVGKTD